MSRIIAVTSIWYDRQESKWKPARKAIVNLDKIQYAYALVSPLVGSTQSEVGTCLNFGPDQEVHVDLTLEQLEELLK